jgi:hypothetical protein
LTQAAYTGVDDELPEPEVVGEVEEEPETEMEREPQMVERDAEEEDDSSDEKEKRSTENQKSSNNVGQILLDVEVEVSKEDVPEMSNKMIETSTKVADKVAERDALVQMKIKTLLLRHSCCGKIS